MTAQTPLRGMPGTILLRSLLDVDDDTGDEKYLQLVFVDKEGMVECWRSTDEEGQSPAMVGIFDGPFGPRAISRLLVSGEVGPPIDMEDAEAADAEGVDERWKDLLRLAWSRVAGTPDSRVLALLGVDDETMDAVENSVGSFDMVGWLKLGEYLAKRNAAWLEKWRSEIEAEVERRLSSEAREEIEGQRAALREWVERCLLTLGRLPRLDEDESTWDGASLRTGQLNENRREELGLVAKERIGRFDVSVQFWTAAYTYGYSDFGPGPGWYFAVLNPDSNWRFNDPVGPYMTPEDALSEASKLDDGDERMSP